MSMPGRNDPCPCGSGKKFKKCHGALASPTGDTVYDRLRRLEGEATYRVLKFARERYGESCMEAAWDQFYDGRGGPYSEDDPEYLYFCRWFEYDWMPEGVRPLAECFLADHKSKNIDSEIRRMMEATLAAPYSFYQAVEIEPGAGFRARDVLREMEVRITERSASTLIEKGNVMFARVVSLDGVSFMMGNGTQPLRAVFLSDLVDVRNELFPAGGPGGNPEGSKTLRESEEYLRGVYFGLTKAQDKSNTDIRNADGDPLVLHTLRYSIRAFEPAFDALKDLEPGGAHRNDADLMAENEVTEVGENVRARIHWLKGKGKGSQGQSVIATITLTDSTMIVEVNSERRSKALQKEMKKRLGDSATLMHIDATPAAGILKEKLNSPAQRTPAPLSEDQRRLRELPEVQGLLKEATEKHWKSWPDTAIPALRGMTPKQAAKDKLGRELLESLLLEYESRSASQPDEFLKVDVDELRRSLGLAKSPPPQREDPAPADRRGGHRSPDPERPSITASPSTNSSRGPKPPAVQHSTWQELYAAARRVHEMKPWEFLDDLDVVVVRDPASGQTGHGVFMGSGGTLFGFCVYRGAGGFYTYKDLIDGKNKGMSDEYLDALDCLKLEFGSREELEPEDLSVIRSLGLSFRGQHSWPQFRRFTPGYAPWFITESEAKFLTLCLEAGCHHHDRVDRMEIDESLRKGEYLVYSPVGVAPGFESRWEQLPERPTGGAPRPVLDIKRLNALRSLTPAAGVAWEADVFHIPVGILDRDRPYMPRMAAACEEASGFVLDTEMSPPEPSTPQLLVNIVCSAAEKSRMLPETVFVKGANEEAALAPLAKTLGFNVGRRKRLKTIQQFKTAAIKQLTM